MQENIFLGFDMVFRDRCLVLILFVVNYSTKKQKSLKVETEYENKKKLRIKFRKKFEFLFANKLSKSDFECVNK